MARGLSQRGVLDGNMLCEEWCHGLPRDLSSRGDGDTHIGVAVVRIAVLVGGRLAYLEGVGNG
jgi:hypothetical protein